MSVIVGEGDVMYVGVQDHGVMSCNVLTGEVGSVVIPCEGSIKGLALCMVCIHYVFVFCKFYFIEYYSACAHGLDTVHAFVPVVACTIRHPCSCGGAVEGAQAQSKHASALRARGDFLEACCVMYFWVGLISHL
jgi:hypothetical protein